jgi:hypothetical protein
MVRVTAGCVSERVIAARPTLFCRATSTKGFEVADLDTPGYTHIDSGMSLEG